MKESGGGMAFGVLGSKKHQKETMHPEGSERKELSGNTRKIVEVDAKSANSALKHKEAEEGER